jgi:uncharacterized membrane protein YecN with MAPEG domain
MALIPGFLLVLLMMEIISLEFPAALLLGQLFLDQKIMHFK